MADQIYASVECAVPGMFRLLESLSEPLFHGGMRVSGSGARERLVRQGTLPDTLVNFLVEMDNKLDAILARLQGEDLTRVFEYSLLTSNLSGGGMRFTCEYPLKPGDNIEVALQLSELPVQTVFVAGSVDRAGAGAYQIEFAGIREQDRDEIIRFVVAEERRQIRQKKS